MVCGVVLIPHPGDQPKLAKRARTFRSSLHHLDSWGEILRWTHCVDANNAILSLPLPVITSQPLPLMRGGWFGFAFVTAQWGRVGRKEVRHERSQEVLRRKQRRPGYLPV